MIKFVIRRLMQAIPTFFGITLLSYLIIVAAPGDPVEMLAFNLRASAETRALLEARLGVNDPWPVQYLRWLIGDDWMTFDTDNDGVPDERGNRLGILRGDFGQSFSLGGSPLKLIAERLPATIELNVVTLIISLTVGLVIGVLAAVWRGGRFDSSTRILAVVGDAVPEFWLGFMALMIFSAPLLGWFPLGGRCAPVRGGCPPIYERIEYMVLPALVVSLGGVAGWSRYMRAAMLENINSDYIRTAKAKGLSDRVVWFKHGLRNALIPMATFLGPAFVGFLGGSVIIENIFSWPGVGQLLFRAVLSQDYPLIMASVVIGSVLTIIGYLISDILYAVFDPRIRL